MVFTISDLVKLYNSKLLNPDCGPRQLQNKVEFDVRFYFCQRGQENIHKMTVDTFNLIYDPETKMSYIKKIHDKMTKKKKQRKEQ